MKKQLLICGTLVCAVIAQASPVGTSRMAKKLQQRRQTVEAAASNSLKWLPTKVENFYWEGNEWMPNSTETNTYDDRGNLLSTSNEYEKRVYEYDENNMPVSYSRYDAYDGNEVLTMSRKYKYDSVVNDYLISEDEIGYNNDGSIAFQYTSVSEVVRDAAGNVTTVTDKSYDYETKQWSVSAVMTVAYKDGKASEINFVEYGNGVAEPDGVKITDLVWDKTNGQILPSDLDEFDEDDFLEGANRLSYAKIMNFEDFPTNVVFKAEFTGNDYKYEMTYNDKLVTSATRKYTDANGSYEEHVVDVDWDDDETGAVYEDGTCTIDYKETYDDFGLLTGLSNKEVYDDGEEWWSETVGNVTYDTVNGYPTEYIGLLRSSWSPEYSYQSRSVYSDYTTVDSVETVMAEDEEAPVVYYNLQGVRVNNPNNGIYIRCRGTQSDKVIIK